MLIILKAKQKNCLIFNNFVMQTLPNFFRSFVNHIKYKKFNIFIENPKREKIFLFGYFIFGNG